MSEVHLEWGGVERRLRLTFGGLMDVEDACGKSAIGDIFLRLGSGRYFARDVYHTIRLALIGGGMSAQEAKALMADRFDAMPLAQSAEAAIEILLAVFAGIEADGKPSGRPQPYDPGPIFAAFARMGMTPEQVRGIEYRDFVALSRGFASEGKGPGAPTEEEYYELLERFGVSADGG